MRKVSWFDGVGGDLRLAARTALKDRAFTAVAVGVIPRLCRRGGDRLEFRRGGGDRSRVSEPQRP